MDSPPPTTLKALLREYPDPLPLSAEQVRAVRRPDTPRLIVLDDDPTGTQSVAGLPVLTGWSESDFAWALGTEAPAVYVLTNSRSLDPGSAASRVREVACNALATAHRLGVPIEFVSRSDSTLRGHYPLEPDVLCAVLAEAGTPVDGVLLVPAFGEAGRITVDTVHYAGSTQEGYLPVGTTEFARDATFGYASSNLRAWVEEKSGGRIRATDVLPITLHVLRAGGDTDSQSGDGLSPLSRALMQLVDGRTAVVDIVEESDLRVLAVGLMQAERTGRRFLHRVGPPFVRALVGQEVPTPLTPVDVAAIRAGGQAADAEHGLVVVGSHVSLTTRQLEVLRTRRHLAEVEIDVATVLGEGRADHLRKVVDAAVRAIASDTVVLQTSRALVAGKSAADSLHIARAVSDAVVETVRRVSESASLRFVVAKGGITSSDIASRGLGITRALVRGPMLPGIVSLWEPIDGPAQGIPYVVFAGNVGDEASLADVVDILSDRPPTRTTTQASTL